MLDLRFLREHAEEAQTRLSNRNLIWEGQVAAILDTDKRRRAEEGALQELQAERNRLSKEIGMLKKKGESTTELEATVKGFAEKMDAARQSSEQALAEQERLLLETPNLPHPECPVGKDADANPVLREWGEKPKHQAEDHLAIANRLGFLDFERAAKISGSGFACFLGEGAKLQRALISFLLDLHATEHGYTEVSPPFLIRRPAMIGTGQLPKFEEDMYALPEDELFLAPTAEVPVTNLYREEILALDQLPRKMTAYTPCFRREAGATGRDTRGLIRMHQFDKVELVQLVHPETSYQVLEELTLHAEEVLKRLGLHYRVIELCTGDLGFSAAKTYDIEVWAPGQDAYLEVSSCSNFEDYQARRMQLRFKDADGKNKFCHTLNGSGTALPRLYVALLETYTKPDGQFEWPKALKPYANRA
ncbi:MAG: serine--tRNA ligase [Verrucomicrobiales bacterium]